MQVTPSHTTVNTGTFKGQNNIPPALPLPGATSLQHYTKVSVGKDMTNPSSGYISAGDQQPPTHTIITNTNTIAITSTNASDLDDVPRSTAQCEDKLEELPLNKVTVQESKHPTHTPSKMVYKSLQHVMEEGSTMTVDCPTAVDKNGNKTAMVGKEIENALGGARQGDGVGENDKETEGDVHTGGTSQEDKVGEDSDGVHTAALKQENEGALDTGGEEGGQLNMKVNDHSPLGVNAEMTQEMVSVVQGFVAAANPPLEPAELDTECDFYMKSKECTK